MSCEAYGDAVYLAWLLGGDPDLVEEEDAERLEEELGDPWAAAELIADRLTRPAREPDPEMEPGDGYFVLRERD